MNEPEAVPAGTEAREEGRDARGYSWPPFEEANTAARRHGAYRESEIAPLAERARFELAAISEDAPWLAAPAFAPAVVAWSRAEAKLALVDAYIEQNGPLDEDGKPRPATEVYLRLERLAADLRGKLALDPVNRARIARDLAGAARDGDLAALREEGRRILAARKADE